MRAVVLREFGDPDVLRFEEVEEPTPAAGEVRVAVRAVIVARTKDVSARSGTHPFSKLLRLPHILGAEHAGIVDAVGDGVDAGMVGCRVTVSAVVPCEQCSWCRRAHEEACDDFTLVGIHRPGAYADKTVVPIGNVRILPDDVSFSDGAAIAGNGAVAHAQLDAGVVYSGTWVLVVGAAGALGATLVSLAQFRGANVVAIDRLPEQQAALDLLGLRAAFDSRQSGLAAAIGEATDGHGIDCVVDNLGLADVWQSYMPALATMGTVVVSGSIGVEPVPLALPPLYLKSQSIVGVRTGNRRHMDLVWQAVSSGWRLPEAFTVEMDMSDVVAAHRAVESGEKHGQLVLLNNVS